MTDFTTPSGSGGTLIIRDVGNTITFLLQNTNGSTFVSGAGWSGIVNGVAVGGTYSISGAQTITLGSWTVTTNQNVQFNIASTGTSGLGGPTTLNHTVTRVSVPPAPSPLSVDQITTTSLRYRFQSNGTGGGTIDQWQIGYGTNSGTPTTFLTSSGTSTITGLIPGTTYYLWSRGHNQAGWGPWSTRTTAKTIAGANVRVAGIWKKAIAWVKVAGTWKQTQPWVKVSGTWKKTT